MFSYCILLLLIIIKVLQDNLTMFSYCILLLLIIIKVLQDNLTMFSDCISILLINLHVANHTESLLIVEKHNHYYKMYCIIPTSTL